MRLPAALALAVAGCVLHLVACAADDPAGKKCHAGESEPCTCENGDEGIAVCGDDRVFQACDCGGGGGTGGSGGSGGSGGGEPVTYHWVTSEIAFPTNAAQANTIGVDLDGDGTIDNALGKALGTLGGAFDPGEAVTTGQLVQLHELTTPSLQAASGITWTVYLGAAEEEPDFGGQGEFTALVPAGALPGTIADGRFAGEGGPLSFPVPMLGGTASLSIQRIRAEATVTAAGGNGMAGGAIPADEFDAAIAAAITAAVELEGCGTDAPCSEALAAVLALLDTNGDYRIDAPELSGNLMWRMLVSPDLDLDEDGTAESLSIGWGFTFVGAVFDPP